MPYSQLSDNLPRDAGNKAFVGPAGKVPAGTVLAGNSNEAVTHVLLVSSDGVTPLVSSSGLLTRQERCSLQTDINVSSTTSSQTLIAANANRKGLVVTNTDANNAYIRYSGTVSTAQWSYKIPSGVTFEMPSPIYTGTVAVIWDGDGSGAMVGSELT